MARGFRVVISGPPVPASRPRVTRWGTYYSKTYTKWMKAAVAEVVVASAALTGALSVTVYAICERARTSKLQFPKGDCDNYAKGPLDVLTKKQYWGDDKQITHLVVRKRFAADGEDPCFIIVAEEIE